MTTAAIDIYAAVVIRDSGNNPPQGVGSVAAPVVTISPTTSTASIPRQTHNAAAGGSAVLFDITGQGSAGQGFEVFWAKATQNGYLAIKTDNDSGTAPNWKYQRMRANTPFIIPDDDDITNSVAGTTGLDSAGAPQGLTDSGRIDTRIRKIVFYPDSSVTSETAIETGRYA